MKHLLLLALVLSVITFSCSKNSKTSKDDSKEKTMVKETAGDSTINPADINKDKKIRTKILTEVNSKGKKYVYSKTDYDREGKEIKEITFFNDGEKKSETTNEYDGKGNIVKKITKGYNIVTENNYTDIVILNYNVKGRLISKQFKFDEKGMTEALPDLYEYKYGDEGRIILREEYMTYTVNDNGKIKKRKTNELISKAVYKYDSKGNLAEELPENINQSYAAAEKVNYEYDSNNKLIKISKDSVTYEVSYEYY